MKESSKELTSYLNYNKLKNLSGFLGYIIGAVIALPLLLLCINYFFLKGNDAKPYISGYIADSILVSISVPSHRPPNVKPGSADYMDYHLSKYKNFTTKLATKNMGRDGSSRNTMDYRVVYDSATKKYFQITMFNLYNNFFGAINDSKILAKVNKQDFFNPLYGTKEKPVLVFSAKGDKKPLEEEIVSNKYPNGLTINLNTSEKQYKYNVYMYLTYIMPKKEFKERFEKGSKQ